MSPRHIDQHCAEDEDDLKHAVKADRKGARAMLRTIGGHHIPGHDVGSLDHSTDPVEECELGTRCGDTVAAWSPR